MGSKRSQSRESLAHTPPMHTLLLMVPHWILVLIPWPPSVSTLPGSHNFVSLSLPRNFELCPPFPSLVSTGYQLCLIKPLLWSVFRSLGLLHPGPFPFDAILLSPASQPLCTHCCCYAGAKYSPPSGSKHVGRAFGDAEASRDMAWPNREKRGAWGHLDCSRTHLTPPQVTCVTYPLPSTGSGH